MDTSILLGQNCDGDTEIGLSLNITLEANGMDFVFGNKEQTGARNEGFEVNHDLEKDHQKGGGAIRSFELTIGDCAGNMNGICPTEPKEFSGPPRSSGAAGGSLRPASPLGTLGPVEERGSGYPLDYEQIVVWYLGNQMAQVDLLYLS